MVGTERMGDGFVVTLFWSRLRDMSPADEVDYRERETHLRRAAERIPGFVGVKSYTGDDGERLSVVVFDSEEAQHQWLVHPGHAAAQGVARDRYYSEYQIVIAHTARHRRWSEQTAETTSADATVTPAPVSATNPSASPSKVATVSGNVVRLPARR